MQTTDSVRSVKGVGEKAEQNLHKLKIETVGELLEHYPRNYDEIKPVYPIEALEEGDIAAVEGVLMARPEINETWLKKYFNDNAAGYDRQFANYVV